MLFWLQERERLARANRGEEDGANHVEKAAAGLQVQSLLSCAKGLLHTPETVVSRHLPVVTCCSQTLANARPTPCHPTHGTPCQTPCPPHASPMPAPCPPHAHPMPAHVNPMPTSRQPYANLMPTLCHANAMPCQPYGMPTLCQPLAMPTPCYLAAVILPLMLADLCRIHQLSLQAFHIWRDQRILSFPSTLQSVKPAVIIIDHSGRWG